MVTNAATYVDTFWSVYSIEKYVTHAKSKNFYK